MAENKNSDKKSDLTDVGAFWKKDNNGKKFLSGKVKIGDTEYTAFIFPNKKEKDTHPDYRLAIAELPEDLKPPDKREAAVAERAAAKAKSSKSAPAAEANDDEIPFN